MNGKQAILISALVALFTVFFKTYDLTDPKYVSPNERPRFFLAHALAARGSVEVTEEVSRFGFSIDMAERTGRYYSDKPVLLSLFGAPVVAAYRLFAGTELSESNALWFLRTTVLLPFALLLFWLVYAAVRTIPASPAIALFAAWSAFFGTPVSTYFTVFFSHSVSAALLFAFFLMIRRILRRPERAFLFVTGLIGGLLFLNEYQTAVPLLVVSLYLFLRLTDRRPTLFFIAGFLPPAVLFISYNLIAFGSPLTFGVVHESFGTFREMHRSGFFGFGLPRPYALYEFLLSLKMGLFSLSPILLFALPGTFRRWREERAGTIALLATIVTYLLMVSSLANHHGGWAFGARYLVPVIPFVSLLAAYGIADLTQRHFIWKGVALTLGLVSCTIFFVANGMRPLVEEIFKNPLANYYLAAARENFITYHSLLTPLGISPRNALIVFLTLAVVATIGVFAPLTEGRTVRRLAIPTATAFLLLMLYLIPYHGDRYERKFFYWMMVQSRQGTDAEIKEKLFEGRFRDAIRIMKDKADAR